MFDLFKSLNSATNSIGNGIGLALVRKLVEQQGGKIRVESFLDDGAPFIFSWPVR